MRRVAASLAACAFVTFLAVAPAWAINNGNLVVIGTGAVAADPAVNNGNLIQAANASSSGDKSHVAPNSLPTWWWLLSLLASGLR